MGVERDTSSVDNRAGDDINRFFDRARISGGARVGLSGVSVVLLAVGCGSEQSAKREGSRPATKPSSTVLHSSTVGRRTHAVTKAGSAAPSESSVGANETYDGPDVICVGHGNPRLARAATPRERRTQKPLNPPPTQMYLHMLPNGKVQGICVWGRNPYLAGQY